MGGKGPICWRLISVLRFLATPGKVNELSKGQEDRSAISDRRCRFAKTEKLLPVVLPNLNLGPRCWWTPAELPHLYSVL